MSGIIDVFASDPRRLLPLAYLIPRGFLRFTDCFIFGCIPNTQRSTCPIRSAQYMLVK